MVSENLDNKMAETIAETDAYAYLKRGTEHINKKDYDQAIADISEAIRLDPTCALSLYTRALAHVDRNDVKHAIVDLEAAVQLDPNHDKAGDLLKKLLASTTTATC